MPNPYLPGWEYIPDGEPRVFGDRVYVYGSHDNAGQDMFCDYVLKVWSAPVNDLNHWVCHGDCFHVLPDRDHPSDTDWTAPHQRLFAPDVVEKDGKYYLFAYILNSIGCVGVADRPEGPFKFLGKYKYNIPDEDCGNGWFVDPGVLVDDDGQIYMGCGYEKSFMVQVDPEDMTHILDGSFVEHVVPIEPRPAYGFNEHDELFFEAFSLRKVGDTYYLIYSPKRGCRLAYATSDKPMGPYTYRGWIVDNGIDYPGGNDHGSICKIGDQWYIFYHRMTNATLTSRRACVEKIEILPDGTIPSVEMTSLGFQDALDPYQPTPADIACVLKGKGFITERNVFDRVITDIQAGTVMGWKYFDFGEDFASKTMLFAAKVRGFGADCDVHILADGEDGEEIGCFHVGHDGGVIETVVKALTGRHAIFLKVTTSYDGWMADWFKGRCLMELCEFVFMK